MVVDTPERVPRPAPSGVARLVRPLIYAVIIGVVATVLIPRALSANDEAAERDAAAAIAESAQTHPQVWGGWSLYVEPIEAPGPVVKLVLTRFTDSDAPPPTREELEDALAGATEHAAIRVIIRIDGSESAQTIPITSSR